jgi:hypothetical protein
MSSRIGKANEIETITAMAAKALVRALESEQKAGEDKFPRGLWGRRSYETLEDARNAAVVDLTWAAIGRLEDEQPGSFAILFERVKQAARDELESGHRAASVALGHESPMIRARFIVLREKYIEEWQLRNVLESQLIDAICQAQTIRDYWTTLATERVAVECEIERYWVDVRGIRSERQIDGSESARGPRRGGAVGQGIYSFCPRFARS